MNLPLSIVTVTFSTRLQLLFSISVCKECCNDALDMSHANENYDLASPYSAPPLWEVGTIAT